MSGADSRSPAPPVHSHGGDGPHRREGGRSQDCAPSDFAEGAPRQRSSPSIFIFNSFSFMFKVIFKVFFYSLKRPLCIIPFMSSEISSFSCPLPRMRAKGLLQLSDAEGLAQLLFHVSFLAACGVVVLWAYENSSWGLLALAQLPVAIAESFLFNGFHERLCIS